MRPFPPPGHGAASGTVLMVTAVLGGLLTAVPAQAQDLEVAAEQAGIALPPSYWEEKARDPLAFELPNGLFGDRRNLPPMATPGLIEQQPARAPFVGTARLPVILALFSDSPDPWITREEVEQSIFTGPAPGGTLTEYYAAASYGQFTVDGDVTPWLRTSTTRADAVGSNYGLGGDSGAGQYMIQALELADPDLDFRQYDNDGPDGIPNSGDDDGIVDAVTFEFLEISASCGGSGIWPHRWGIAGWTGGQAWVTDDLGASGSPILVNSYIIQSAADCSGAEVQTASTIAHEFGHVLGLPDYYHAVGGVEPEKRRWVLGCWDLMAAGSWGCGPVNTRTSFGPTHMTAYNRWRLGWLDPQDVGQVKDTVIDLAPIRTTGQALRIPLEGSSAESVLLVEYRDQEGFDADLPGSGVLVTRYDPNGSLRPSSGYRYRVSVLEADADQGLFRSFAEGGDRGVVTDVFGISGGPSRLNNVSTPSTLAPNGASNGVMFHEIALTATGARIRLTNDLNPEFVASADTLRLQALTPFQLSYRILGGALPARLTVENNAIEPGGIVQPLRLLLDQDTVGLQGVPLVPGTHQFAMTMQDLLGTRTTASVVLEVDPWTPAWSDVVAGYLRITSLPEYADAYLDSNGNRNGGLDVGDLRAFRYGGGS